MLASLFSSLAVGLLILPTVFVSSVLALPVDPSPADRTGVTTATFNPTALGATTTVTNVKREPAKKKPKKQPPIPSDPVSTTTETIAATINGTAFTVYLTSTDWQTPTWTESFAVTGTFNDTTLTASAVVTHYKPKEDNEKREATLFPVSTPVSILTDVATTATTATATATATASASGTFNDDDSPLPVSTLRTQVKREPDALIRSSPTYPPVTTVTAIDTATFSDTTFTVTLTRTQWVRDAAMPTRQIHEVDAEESAKPKPMPKPKHAVAAEAETEAGIEAEEKAKAEMEMKAKTEDKAPLEGRRKIWPPPPFFPIPGSKSGSKSGSGSKASHKSGSRFAPGAAAAFVAVNGRNQSRTWHQPPHVVRAAVAAPAPAETSKVHNGVLAYTDFTTTSWYTPEPLAPFTTRPFPHFENIVVPNGDGAAKALDGKGRHINHEHGRFGFAPGPVSATLDPVEQTATATATTASTEATVTAEMPTNTNTNAEPMFSILPFTEEHDASTT